MAPHQDLTVCAFIVYLMAYDAYLCFNNLRFHVMSNKKFQKLVDVARVQEGSSIYDNFFKGENSVHFTQILSKWCVHEGKYHTNPVLDR